ncbi:MAG: hypothetical protein ACYCST_07715 [Acidimicrobiales bacterium]
MRQLLAPGQRRLHFVDESATRRRAILSAIARLPVSAHVYSCSIREPAARSLVMSALIAGLPLGTRRLIIESRGERDREDRRLLVGLRKAGTFPPDLAYDHLRAHEEPLVWIPDAVAWCWGRRQWSGRLADILRSSTRVPEMRKTRPLLVRGGAGLYFPRLSATG